MKVISWDVPHPIREEQVDTRDESSLMRIFAESIRLLRGAAGYVVLSPEESRDILQGIPEGVSPEEWARSTTESQMKLYGRILIVEFVDDMLTFYFE